MKPYVTILIFLSICFTEIGVHLIASDDHQTVLIDSKTETENENEKSEKELGEDEKDIVDFSELNFRSKDATDSNRNAISIEYAINSYLEIHLPPPDFV